MSKITKRGNSYYFARTRKGVTRSFGPYTSEADAQEAVKRVDAAIPAVSRQVKTEAERIAEFNAACDAA